MKPRILIVEDEPGIADTLQYALCTDGFEPAWVATGEAALLELQERPPALVVLDVGLPDTNGFELFKQLRALADVPVLFLTARSDEIDRVVGLELGADDYVPKPCNPREIAARLRAILRRTRGDSDGARLDDLNIGPVSLRAASRSVTLRGEPVALTGTEFNILAALMRDAGRVVSKDTLSQAVLGRPLGPFDRSIDVHISKLRRKLGPAADGDSLINTIHRGGYLFRVVRES